MQLLEGAQLPYQAQFDSMGRNSQQQRSHHRFFLLVLVSNGGMYYNTKCSRVLGAPCLRHAMVMPCSSIRVSFIRMCASIINGPGPMRTMPEPCGGYESREAIYVAGETTVSRDADCHLPLPFDVGGPPVGPAGYSLYFVDVLVDELGA